MPAGAVIATVRVQARLSGAALHSSIIRIGFGAKVGLTLTASHLFGCDPSGLAITLHVEEFNMALRKDYLIPRFYKDTREVPFRLQWRKKRMRRLVRRAAKSLIARGIYEQPIIACAKEFYF